MGLGYIDYNLYIVVRMWVRWQGLPRDFRGQGAKLQEKDPKRLRQAVAIESKVTFYNLEVCSM